MSILDLMRLEVKIKLFISVKTLYIYWLPQWGLGSKYQSICYESWTYKYCQTFYKINNLDDLKFLNIKLLMLILQNNLKL